MSTARRVEVWVEPKMLQDSLGLLETPASDLRTSCKFRWPHLEVKLVCARSGNLRAPLDLLAPQASAIFE